MNFTTSLQIPGSNYTIVVSGIRDRSTNANLIASNSTASFFAQSRLGAAANVPEAADYHLVYALDIPVANPNWNANGVAYAYDAHTSVTQPFSRIAYYLELQPLDEPLEFIFVSMDAFTNDPARIGVPSVPSGFFYQADVTNMSVFSNVEGVQTGTGLTGGNIEFWPSNYDDQNVANVPNARNDIYDWGDAPVSAVLSYGSMQVHNHGASQVLLAYNRWGSSGGNSEVGIGNNFANTNFANTAREQDYTFMSNAGNYSIRRLEILVLLPPVLNARFTNTQFMVSWPAAHRDFSLQSAASLLSPNWATVTNVVKETNNLNFVVIDTPGTNRFFRLLK